jgi:hypothetical protein
VEIVSKSRTDYADTRVAYNRSHSDMTNGLFQCSGVVKNQQSLSRKARRQALESLLVCLLSWSSHFFLRRCRDKRKEAAREKDRPATVELGSRNRVGDGDHPPDYCSVAATAAASVHSVQTHGRDEPLPEYAICTSRNDLNYVNRTIIYSN